MVLASLLLCLFVAPAPLFGEDARESPGDSAAPAAGEFVVAIHDDRISLNANAAPLAPLLAEIGRRLNIEVAAPIPIEETVTLVFDRLSLEEALKRFSPYVDVVYVKSEETGPGQIVKLTMIPKQEPPGHSTSSEKGWELPKGPVNRVPQPEPFRFEFDPSSSVKRP
jgi:hypothetical protein